MTIQELFKTLSAIDVSKHVEKRTDGKVELSYLSWAWAWSELVSCVPDATYQVRMFDGKPYIYDENLGYIVFTEITCLGLTRECWLPVLDSKNKTMRAESYQYKTKYETKTVERASMFDVNKTIMRCLAKNIAMFGLGLSLYRGEDLPDNAEPEKEKRKVETFSKEQVSMAMERYGQIVLDACREMGYENPTDIPISEKSEFFGRCKRLENENNETGESAK